MGENKTIKMTVFADLHYKKGMYIAGVRDLEEILERAKDNGSDFLIHAGDFSNDYIGSPELTDAYLSNKYGIPVYGVYGNHELESQGNSMSEVTKMLANRPVVWGTESGDILNGDIAYYYFDRGGFRIIGLDTNYSYNPDLEIWEHNKTASFGAPKGNIKTCSLGPTQIDWLREVLFDAAERSLRSIVVSHRGFCDLLRCCPDHAQVREIFRAVNKKRRGTVMLAISGDLHTNHQALIEDVVYFDVNTVRNGVWLPKGVAHYDGLTFPYVDYDSNGAPLGQYDRDLAELRMSPNTWFFSSALSANVTVSENGEIKIEGSRSSWYGGIAPPVNDATPYIDSGYYRVFD